MSILSFNGVAIEFGGEAILENVSVTVSRGDRWGIVGRNGTGKTTLLRLITGELEPSRGSIARASGLRVSLLEQHRTFEGASNVWDAAAQPYAELVALEKSLAEQAAALAHDASDGALARYDRDLHRFEREGGYTFHARVDAVLHGLGFDPAEARTRPLAELSGGERGRVGLARQLVAPADLLLLDEPTNHLDLETTRWLEEYLLGIDETVLVISHDRAFLDRIVDHVLHLEAGTAFVYDAGYAAFVAQRNERRVTQQRAFDQQQRKVAAEEDYIRRNIAGQNSRQAKGRRTRLARLPRLAAPPGEEAVMSLRLRPSARGGDQVVVAEDVRLAVDGRVLLDDFSARVTRGEVVGLIGANGSGKSTLLRAIAGERPVQGGTVRVGESIRLAYYRQDLAQVPADKSLFDTIHDLRPLWDRGQVQGHLGRFGFSGDVVQRIAGTLSGGEQARLALAMMMLSGGNLLLIDEPTNHLDVESIEALEDALVEFDGTLILVSHDRALLETLVERVWSLRDGRIEDYPGSFVEFEDVVRDRRREENAAAAATEIERREAERRRSHRVNDVAQGRRMEVRSAREALDDAEAIAHVAGARVAELEAALADPALYVASADRSRAASLGIELAAARAELERAFEAWTGAEEALARIEAPR